MRPLNAAECTRAVRPRLSMGLRPLSAWPTGACPAFVDIRDLDLTIGNPEPSLQHHGAQLALATGAEIGGRDGVGGIAGVAPQFMGSGRESGPNTADGVVIRACF